MASFESRTFALRHPTETGRVIRGRVDVPSGALAVSGRAPCAILLHGFKGFMDWGFFPDMARRLASHGVASVRFNASGSGVGEDLETFTELGAFERNTLTREIEDIESVREWIDDGGVPEIDPERAVVVGHSRGGGLALVHAAESRAYRGVVTWASVATFDRFDELEKQMWRRQGFLPVQNARTGQEMRLGLAALEDLERHRDRFDVPSACRRLDAPTLLVHGTADESVPVEESELLFACLDPSRSAFLRIQGAGHTFGIRHPMTASTGAWEANAQATLARIQELVG